MFHEFDNPGPPSAPRPASTRPQWMALLARTPLPMLEQALQAHQALRRIEWLRRPESGLYMVQGRAGATGERFNLGELTVTRCALRSHSASSGQTSVGVAYVLGRNHRQAELAALADALLQEPALHDALEQSLLTPVRQHLHLQLAQHQAQVQSTRVDFFTVAREAGSQTDEEEQA